jgi:hypothetical protein
LVAFKLEVNGPIELKERFEELALDEVLGKMKLQVWEGGGEGRDQLRKVPFSL